MIIARSYTEAASLGAESLIKDADDTWRCYMPGEIVRQPGPPPPLVVSAWSFRKALNRLGLRAQVDAALVNADQDTKDGWAIATEYWSTDPLILAMTAALGKTEAEMLQVFELAGTLTQ